MQMLIYIYIYNAPGGYCESVVIEVTKRRRQFLFQKLGKQQMIAVIQKVLTITQENESHTWNCNKQLNALLYCFEEEK